MINNILSPTLFELEPLPPGRLFQSESLKIGTTPWRFFVYEEKEWWLDKKHHRFTDYEWFDGQYWQPARKWPTYDDHHTHDGLPTQLVGLYEKNRMQADMLLKETGDTYEQYLEQQLGSKK